MNDPQEDTDSENTDLRDSMDSSEAYTQSSFSKESHQESSPQNTITNTVHSGNTLPPEDVQDPLPPYPLSTNSNLVFGDLSGEQLTSTITRSYELIVHWKPNVFLVPSGRQGKRFVDELTRLFNAFHTDSSLQPVAIEAAMLLPALMLQKPIGKLKTRELVQILKRRLDQWDSGDIPGLLEEGKLIQNRIERIPRKSNRDDRLACTYLCQIDHVRQDTLSTTTPIKTESTGWCTQAGHYIGWEVYKRNTPQQTPKRTASR